MTGGKKKTIKFSSHRRGEGGEATEQPQQSPSMFPGYLNNQVAVGYCECMHGVAVGYCECMHGVAVGTG